MKQLRVALLFLITLILICSASLGFTCKEAERNALLEFKNGFVSPLGSWVGEDCCSWKGVGCDNVTGNVVKLDLHGDDQSSDDELSPIYVGAKVSPALLELKYLTYLDLSGIDFSGSTISAIFGSMRQLQYLNLSSTYFSREVPLHLGNLTELVVLDLSWGPDGEMNNIEWAFKLENLKYLDLSGIDLSQAPNSLNLPYKLPSLSVLILSGCRLENSHIVTRNSTISSSTLRHLDLCFNDFSGQIPHFIQNLSSIRFLDLSHNHLESPIPSWLGNKGNLGYLSLCDNDFNGPFPNSIQNLSSIRFLDLSFNHFNSSALSWLGNKGNLRYLSLHHNHFNGPFPNSIQNLSFLTSLDLSYNHFTSSIPSWLANKTYLEYLSVHNNYFDRVDGGIMSIIDHLCKLRHLDLSDNQLQEEVSESNVNFSRCTKYDLEHLYMQNNSINGYLPTTKSLLSLRVLDVSYNDIATLPASMGGLLSLQFLYLSYNSLSVVHQVSLANLSSLTYLDISSNSATFNLSLDWMPPFRLKFLSVLPCKLNSPFPKWILSQDNLEELDLTDTGIFGPLPHNIGSAMLSLQILRLANNHINGSIPRSLCGMSSLWVLDLQKNALSGMIPDCWSLMVGMELSSNRLSGRIPNSLAKVVGLQLLSLSNNSLEGELPLALSNSSDLMVFDVGRNNLHGKIPHWNGTNFPCLQILILRENRFNGTIPPQLCSFPALHIIDVASNNLVGTIPRCFGYFKRMGFIKSNDTSNVTNEWSAVEVIKGEDREYTTNLHMLVNMDLSSNHLVGVIPAEITRLSLLLGLNLSHNHLNGTIPREIGKMRSLESLDLSFNNLSGSIPETISSLDSLSKMNFSFNNLQGQIPTGRHLQTLNDSSIYMGNSGLCGDPLPKKCFGGGSAHLPTSPVLEDGGDNKREKMWFYMVIILGFAVGFWGVIGILVVHKRWRHVYFRIAEELADWIYVGVAVMLNARANRGR